MTELELKALMTPEQIIEFNRRRLEDGEVFTELSEDKTKVVGFRDPINPYKRDKR